MGRYKANFVFHFSPIRASDFHSQLATARYLNQILLKKLQIRTVALLGCKRGVEYFLCLNIPYIISYGHSSVSFLQIEGSSIKECLLQ